MTLISNGDVSDIRRGGDDRAVEIDGAFVSKMERLSPDDRSVVLRLVDALLALQTLKVTTSH